MKAIEITRPGPPDVLRLVDRPDPAPGPGEVLIEVAAAGVNRPDLMQREGHYPPPRGVTDIPGLEVAGTIVGLGRGDGDGDSNGNGVPRRATGRAWAMGDRVCALVAGGGYAERVAVPGVQCLPAPDGLTPVEAAALPETYFTVWTNVFSADRGRLRAGETLLVHGGTSGIGTTAIALATRRGSRVIATAGTEAKCAAIRAMGAEAIDYRATDFVEAVRAATDDRGVDVILDIVGGDYLPRNVACLAKDGRLVQIGLMGGREGRLPLGDVIRRRLTITGSTLRIRPPAEKGRIAAALEHEVWPLFAAGLRPVVQATFPLAEAAAAHVRLEAGTVVGKVVLLVGPDATR
ncbi:MAG: NAD(P)H-quinone oxidoreductase [Vicinamibacterales bacterium]